MATFRFTLLAAWSEDGDAYESLAEDEEEDEEEGEGDEDGGGGFEG
jgi:hypothetical protein